MNEPRLAVKNAMNHQNDGQEVAPMLNRDMQKTFSQCSCCNVTKMSKHGTDYEIQLSVGYRVVQEV